MSNKNKEWNKKFTTRRSNVSKDMLRNNGSSKPNATMRNYASYLPYVYSGFDNRTQRYKQYDEMDQDPEIRTALDILADFCTQNNEDHGNALFINYKSSDVNDSIVKTIENRFNSWYTMNDLKIKIRSIVRGTLKKGDFFFIRDPETGELYYVPPENVQRITVNEKEGKKPIIYYIRNIQLNLLDKVISNELYSPTSTAYPSAMPNTLSNSNNYGAGNLGGSDNSQPFSTGGYNDVLPVDAEHVVHITLNVGLDGFFPFGESILENIFKVYKQKALLEDSVIIYRVQRAPERRVFRIDVGDMLPAQANQAVEQFKNELHQRRIPSNKGGSTSLMDATYNPMSILEDFFLPISADGKGSDITTLPGGDNLGQIDDMRYFNNKLIRGLGIPSSYLPFGPEDGGTIFNDGGIGKTLVQELRFNKTCLYYQSLIAKVFDYEFKYWLRLSGHNVDNESFEVVFKPPMNFASYRQIEVQQMAINTYMPLISLPFMSKYFIMTKLGFTKEEIAENNKWYMIENKERIENEGNKAEIPQEEAGLDAVGITDSTGMPDDTLDDSGMESAENSFNPNDINSF